MRTVSLSAVALLGGPPRPNGHGRRSGRDMSGQAATIVGTPGRQITGTEGADVIVTNGATQVDARAAMTSCADRWGSHHRYPRRRGRYVHRLQRRTLQVFAGTAAGTDTEADVIRFSRVGRVTSGMAGQPNADIIDLADYG